jgi:predicted  nucleic acid-binding Zn-ribbon protein
VSSAWLSAAIVEFEQVTLDNGTELFRVRARARRGEDPEPRPLLITREGDATAHTYEPLSSGGDRRGLLRLAYAVPTERVGPSTAFSLQLPDGYRIELPEPTPGESRTDPADGQRWEDDEPGWEQPESPESGDGVAQRIAELEQELGELRSSGDALRQRLAELTTEHEQAGTAAARDREELESLRGSHGAVDEELQSTRESVAHALSELELAHAERDAARQAAESAQADRDAARRDAESAQAERDAARQAVESAQAERDAARQAVESAQADRDAARRDAESAQAERDTAQQAAEVAEAARVERDEAPQTTRGDSDERAQLTGRVRQLEARIELLRADATAARPGTDPRLRQLESEREQLITHVQALAELLSIDKRVGDAGDAAEPGDAVTETAADRLEAIRARAVREANDDAERELRRLRAGTPL